MPKHSSDDEFLRNHRAATEASRYACPNGAPIRDQQHLDELARAGTPRRTAQPARNEFSGFQQFLDRDTGRTYGSFEVFYSAGPRADCDTRLVAPEEGWYWWACFPGCVPDSEDPTGPFPTSEGAYLDAIGD